MKVYQVPVTVLEYRTLTVKAHSAAEAKEKASDGRYVSLGRRERRGVLTVGDPEEYSAYVPTPSPTETSDDA